MKTVNEICYRSHYWIEDAQLHSLSMPYLTSVTRLLALFDVFFGKV